MSFPLLFMQTTRNQSATARKEEAAELQTFHTNYQVHSAVIGPVAAHVSMLTRRPKFQHPKGMLTSRNIFPASRHSWFIACHVPNAYRQCTLGRLNAGWRTAFENIAWMSSKGRITFLYLPTSTKESIQWRT